MESTNSNHNRRIVLSLFDRTGNMVRPWADAGYECWCVDIQHKEDRTEHVGHGFIRYMPADLRWWIPPISEYRVVFAFPPCTHLAVSGARWFAGKGLPALIDGLELVERARRICESIPAPWMLENPVSTLSTYWRPPDFTFNPCDFGGYLEPEGDAYTKKTCLWVGNGFVMPQARPVPPTEGSRMHRLPPSQDRAARRSETPAGFARAVFLANHQH